MVRGFGSSRPTDSSLKSFLTVGLSITVFLFAVVGRQTAVNFLLFWMTSGCLWYAVHDFEKALSLFVFTIPFEQVFSGWGDGRWNTLTYLFLLMVLARKFLSGQKMDFRRLASTEIYILAWLAWSAISLLWSPANGFGLVTHAGGLLVLLIYARNTSSPSVAQRWFWYFVLGSLCVTLSQLLYYESGTAMYWHESKGTWQPSALGLGQGLSAVKFGRTAVISGIAALALWEFEVGPRKKIAFLIAIFFGSIAILSASRANMLILALALPAWMYFSPSLSGRLKKIAIMVVLVFAMANVIWLVNPEAIMLRFEQTIGGYRRGDMGRISGGRDVLLTAGLQMFNENRWVGIGYGGFDTVYRELTGARALNDHNEYLAAFAETGVIGGLLFMAFVLSMGGKALRAGPARHIALAWWVSFAVAILFAGIGRSKDFWFVLGITLALANYYQVVPSRYAGRRTRRRKTDSRIRHSAKPTIAHS